MFIVFKTPCHLKCKKYKKATLVYSNNSEVRSDRQTEELQPIYVLFRLQAGAAWSAFLYVCLCLTLRDWPVSF